MTIMKKLVGRLKTRLLLFLISKQSFINRFLDKLSETRPGDIACKADPNLVVTAFPDQVIDIVVQGYGDKILDHMCERRLADVITMVNMKTGGRFKYVGGEEIKVIIGSGPQRMEGWLATDIERLNVVDESSWSRLFNPDSIDRILAEHVLEHLTLRELRYALKNAYCYLKSGGMLRLAVPDAFHPSRYYYNLVKPGGWETPYEHMLFLDHEMLSRIAQEVGFEVRLLEYFDESGIFHGFKYNSEDGVIKRCAQSNVGLNIRDPLVMEQFYASIPEHLRKQFGDHQMTYTSLIVDLVKPR